MWHKQNCDKKKLFKKHNCCYSMTFFEVFHYNLFGRTPLSGATFESNDKCHKMIESVIEIKTANTN